MEDRINKRVFIGNLSSHRENITFKSYIPSLNFLRGVAALSVALYHFSLGNPVFLQDGNVLKKIGNYGYLGVEVFFVISGFIIPFAMYQAGYKLKDFKCFLFKRFLRIEPPYLVSILIILLLKYLSTISPLYEGPPFQVSFVGLILHLGYLNAFFNYEWIAAIYWTLAIEFQFYLVISIIFPLIKKSKIDASFLACLLVLNFLKLIVPFEKTFFDYSLLFTTGILAFKIYTNSSYQYYLLLLINFIIIYFVFPLPIFLATLFPIPFILKINIESKIFLFLGNISYSFYLLHSAFGSRILNLSMRFIEDDLHRSFLVILTILICIGISYIYYLLIEKPSIRLSKKIRLGDNHKFDKITNSLPTS